MKLSHNSVKRINECGLVGVLTSFPPPQKIIVQITGWKKMDKQNIAARLMMSDGLT
jgi:hypothetical protein